MITFCFTRVTYAALSLILLQKLDSEEETCIREKPRLLTSLKKGWPPSMAESY